MTASRRILTSVYLSLALGLAAATGARADSVYVGGTYSGTFSMMVDGAPMSEGGGNIGGSSVVVGGQTFNLLALYCVDQFTGASLNTNYTTTINQSGVINSQVLPAAGSIAWLMINIAPSLTTQAQYQALQGLIWELESPANGHTVAFNTTAGVNSAAAIANYTAYKTSLGTNTASPSALYWINPLNTQGQYAYQGFVGITQSQRDQATSVPEPASLALFGVAIAALAALRRRAPRLGPEVR